MSNWKMALSSADVSPVTAPILLNGTIPENLRKAARLGYDAIEVHMREDFPVDYDAIHAATQECGTKVAMVITGRLNTEGKCSLIDDIPYVSRAAEEGMNQYIDVAAKLNAGLVIGWVKGNVPAGRPRGFYLDRLARSLRRIGSRAADMGVPVNIEVINRYEVNIFNTSAETAQFIAEHDLKNCFVHLDTFHMAIEETSIPDAIRTAGDKLGYFHLADNHRHACGTGALNFREILAALKEIGYQGYLSVECLPLPDGETAARQSLEHIRSCL